MLASVCLGVVSGDICVGSARLEWGQVIIAGWQTLPLYLSLGLLWPNIWFRHFIRYLIERNICIYAQLVFFGDGDNVLRWQRWLYWGILGN